jgi:hypothetical protein
VTPRDFCQSETSNGLKGAVHVGMLVGSAACCIYNFAAWCYRGQAHNGVNAVVYFGLTCLEVAHVQHHTQRSVMGTPTSVTNGR